MLIGMLLEDMLADSATTSPRSCRGSRTRLAAAEKDNFDLAILDVHLHGESVAADVTLEAALGAADDRVGLNSDSPQLA